MSVVPVVRPGKYCSALSITGDSDGTLVFWRGAYCAPVACPHRATPAVHPLRINVIVRNRAVIFPRDNCAPGSIGCHNYILLYIGDYTNRDAIECPLSITSRTHTLSINILL